MVARRPVPHRLHALIRVLFVRQKVDVAKMTRINDGTKQQMETARFPFPFLFIFIFVFLFVFSLCFCSFCCVFLPFPFLFGLFRGGRWKHLLVGKLKPVRMKASENHE